MLEVIKQLLVLQERDRRILQLQSELDSMSPQRQMLQSKMAGAQGQLESNRQKLRQAESDLKKCELEAEASQQQIAKYSLQQYQTKKNDEYRALAHEIETCKQTILKLEDQQLEFMEQAEKLHKEVAACAQVAKEANQVVQSQMNDIAAREQTLARQLAELQAGRDQLAAAVEESGRARYERILKHRGEKVVVGITHGVCAGCHMTLPPQVLISCQTDQEIVSCPNCGRILFFSPEMDLASTE